MSEHRITGQLGLHVTSGYFLAQPLCPGRAHFDLKYFVLTAMNYAEFYLETRINFSGFSLFSVTFWK